jgi:hypothetical protein
VNRQAKERGMTEEAVLEASHPGGNKGARLAADANVTVNATRTILTCWLSQFTWALRVVE